ncbi:MAG: epoxyqueuosine reductase [bacterium]|nr:epoxyqueuosine reductase [bacterium]
MKRSPHTTAGRAAAAASPDSALTEALRRFLRGEGADLVGFGPSALLESAPEIMRPSRYLPAARSLVSIALHVNEAVCDLIASSVDERQAPASYYSYQRFTLSIINPKLDDLAYLGAKFLEDRGWLAYPVPANLPHDLRPTAEYAGGPGDVSHKHAAVACGLGEIGWHNLLLTPQFGSRQKLVTIVTEAPLDSDPLSTDRLCDPEACEYACARACPTTAIPRSEDEKVSIRIGEKTAEYARLVGWRCRWGCSGMLRCTGGAKDIPMPKTEPTAEELLQYKAQGDPWQERLKRYAGLIPYCGRCLCVCPVPQGGSRLGERTGDIANTAGR